MPRCTAKVNAKTRKGLVKVYRAIGQLDPRTVCKDIHDAETGRVRVTIDSAVYPSIEVRYVHRLRPTDRCRIETATETRTRLVCETT